MSPFAVAALLPAVLAVLAAPARADVWDTVNDKDRAEAIARLMTERFVASEHPDYIVMYVKSAHITPVTDFNGKPAFSVQIVRQPLFKHSSPPERGQRVLKLTSACGQVPDEGMDKENAYLNYLYARVGETGLFKPLPAVIKMPELPDYFAKEAALDFSAADMRKIVECKAELDKKEAAYPLASLEAVGFGGAAQWKLTSLVPETIDAKGEWEVQTFVVKAKAGRQREVKVDARAKWVSFCDGKGMGSELQPAPEAQVIAADKDGFTYKVPELTAPVAKLGANCFPVLESATYRVFAGAELLKTFVIEPVTGP